VKSRSHLSLLLLLFVLLSSTSVFAQTAAQPADLVVLRDGQNKYPLGRHLEILRDPDGELTFQDVTSTAYRDQFTLSQVETPNFGYQSAAYWVRFRVRNQFEQINKWVLELSFSNMHYMDLYLPAPDDTGYLVKESGVLRPYESRDYPYHHLSFNLDLPPGSGQTIYIRFQNRASMTLPLVLWSQSAFTGHMLVDQLTLGAFYGILLIMALYNSFLFFLIRDRTYMYLVLLIAGTGIFFLFYDAVIFQFVPIALSRWATSTLLIFQGIILFSSIKFVDSLLDLKNQSPINHLCANITAGIMIISSIVAIFTEYRLVVVPQIVIAILLFILFFGLSLLFWRAGYRPARYLFISWIWIFIGGILAGLSRLSVLPSTPLTEELGRFGLVWMAGVWSLALADRVNTLKAEADRTNHQLRESEIRLAQFLEAMPVGVAVYGADLKPRYINRKTQRMLTNPARGIAPDMSFQRPMQEMLDYFSLRIAGTDQHYPLERLPLMRAMDGKPASADDIEIDLVDYRIPVEVWASPLLDPIGEVSGTIAVFQDISERLQREALLRETREFQRLALESARLGTWANDLVSGEVLWDARTREIFGVAPDERATLELGFSLIHPEDRQRAQTAFEQAIAPQSDGVYTEEKRIVCPDGKVRWIATKGKAIFEDQGAERRAVRLVGVVMDVTESKLAELTLKESEARYRKLVETMNEGLGVADENHLLTYVNPRLAEMLGYSPEEMIGYSLTKFFDQENRKIIEDQIARRRQGEEQVYMITWHRKDGSDLHTLVAPAGIFNQAREFQGSIAVVTDISEQVKASQLLDQRVAERTHELQTLLDVSKLMVSTLDLDPLLQVILEELKSVIDFRGAAIFSLTDHRLISLEFQLEIEEEIATEIVRPFLQPDFLNQRLRHGEAIIMPDVWEDSDDTRDFREVTASVFGFVPPEMRSWMGVPIKSKEQLIGFLSIHHAQPDYYTPAMADLMQAFANQVAVVIENSRLYRQAQAAAAAEERNRLARELHDSVTQALYSLNLYAGATRAAIMAGKLEVAKKNLDEVVAIAREGMGDLRLLIYELRPPILEQEGLVGALQIRLEAVETRVGIHTEFHVQGQPKLSPEMETELYWSVHEALNNILKHARAKRVELDLDFSNGLATITLRDDGVGFDTSSLDSSNKHGLKNITERVERLGGKIKLESKPGQGTIFEIKLGEERDSTTEDGKHDGIPKTPFN
jgi:PAS domain S-box-containing protein